MDRNPPYHRGIGTKPPRFLGNRNLEKPDNDLSMGGCSAVRQCVSSALSQIAFRIRAIRPRPLPHALPPKYNGDGPTRLREPYSVKIRTLCYTDVGRIASAFSDLGWDKPASLFERYLSEQEAAQRLVLVADLRATLAGYVTIQWVSNYPPFAKHGVPEIKDLNVLPPFQRQGIATALLAETELRIVRRSPVAGIGVGMTPDYGPAQRLYAKLGYMPDGLGLFHTNRHVTSGEQVTVDHLIQFLTKRLTRRPVV